MSDGIDDLRGAARRALEALGDAGASGSAGPGASAATINRAVVDVTVDGRTEMVTFSLRDGELSFSVSDANRRGPHVLEALRLIAAGAEELPKGVRTSPGELSAESPRLSIPPKKDDGRTSDPEPAKHTLSDDLRDLVTAICRVGIREAREAPTVKEALERVGQAAGSPMPLGMARSLGMLRFALSRLDVDGVARILEGASRIAEDLRNEEPTQRERERLVTWLGGGVVGDGRLRVSDRTLVEVGREYLAGLGRFDIDRRYLLCLGTGEVFREERGRNQSGASVGPTPRVLTVGLGEVDKGAGPRAIRLLQYAVSNVLKSATVSRVREVAHADFSDITARYRESLELHPGITEPFFVVAPTRVETDPAVHLVDREGATLPISRADGLGQAEALRQLLGPNQKIEWVSGRIVDTEGSPLLVPCAVGYRDDGTARVRRLA